MVGRIKALNKDATYQLMPYPSEQNPTPHVHKHVVIKSIRCATPEEVLQFGDQEPGPLGSAHTTTSSASTNLKANTNVNASSGSDSTTVTNGTKPHHYHHAPGALKDLPRDSMANMSADSAASKVKDNKVKDNEDSSNRSSNSHAHEHGLVTLSGTAHQHELPPDTRVEVNADGKGTWIAGIIRRDYGQHSGMYEVGKLV